MFKFFSALPDGATIEYEISNHGFSDFSADVLSFLWVTCTDTELCSLVVMGREVLQISRSCRYCSASE